MYIITVFIIIYLMYSIIAYNTMESPLKYKGSVIVDKDSSNIKTNYWLVLNQNDTIKTICVPKYYYFSYKISDTIK